MQDARPLITLLTDFGERDSFVASMKGVILSINSTAAVVDLSHQIASHQIQEAGYFLKSCYRYFPAGTIHVAVVDPGVGTERRALLDFLEYVAERRESDKPFEIIMEGTTPTGDHSAAVVQVRPFAEAGAQVVVSNHLGQRGGVLLEGHAALPVVAVVDPLVLRALRIVEEGPRRPVLLGVEALVLVGTERCQHGLHHGLNGRQGGHEEVALQARGRRQRAVGRV